MPQMTDVCAKCGMAYGRHSAGAKAQCPNPQWVIGSRSDKWLAQEFSSTTAAPVAAAPAPRRGGMRCSGGCDNFNEYAEPNRPDGSFVCYSCRKRG